MSKVVRVELQDRRHQQLNITIIECRCKDKFFDENTIKQCPHNIQWLFHFLKELIEVCEVIISTNASWCLNRTYFCTNIIFRHHDAADSQVLPA